MNNKTHRFLLVVIACLLAANLLVDIRAGSAQTAVAAGIPDSGAQLQAVVDQLVDLNKRIDKMEGYLESGKMTVNVKDPKTDK